MSAAAKEALLAARLAEGWTPEGLTFVTTIAAEVAATRITTWVAGEALEKKDRITLTPPEGNVPTEAEKVWACFAEPI